MNREVVLCVCKHTLPDGTVCGHQWIPRSFLKPGRCPKCQSRAWDKPKKEVNNEPNNF